MHGNAAEEDRFPVEQNLCAASFDGAESDLVAEGISARRQLHFVQLWVLGRPEIELCREMEFAVALAIRGDNLLDFGFGNFERDLLGRVRSAI